MFIFMIWTDKFLFVLLVVYVAQDVYVVHNGIFSQDIPHLQYEYNSGLKRLWESWD